MQSSKGVREKCGQATRNSAPRRYVPHPPPPPPPPAGALTPSSVCRWPCRRTDDSRQRVWTPAVAAATADPHRGTPAPKASLQCWDGPTKDKQVPVPAPVNIRGTLSLRLCLSQRHAVPPRHAPYATAAKDGGGSQPTPLPSALFVCFLLFFFLWVGTCRSKSG